MLEHLFHKHSEADLLRVHAGDVGVIHVEHAEELHARLAVISRQSGHYRVGPLLHADQLVLITLALRIFCPRVVRLDHQDLCDRAEQADVPAAGSGFALEARRYESHVPEHTLDVSSQALSVVQDFLLARL